MNRFAKATLRWVIFEMLYKIYLWVACGSSKVFLMSIFQAKYNLLAASLKRFYKFEPYIQVKYRLTNLIKTSGCWALTFMYIWPRCREIMIHTGKVGL